MKKPIFLFASHKTLLSLLASILPTYMTSFSTGIFSLLKSITVKFETTMEQRNTILGIEIELYEYFISFHKPPVRIFFDEREVEAIRRRVAEKILAEEAKNIEEKNLVILNPPEDLDCSALFTDLVNSFSFDAVYRYSKAYAMISVLGEALLLVIFLLVMFFAMLTVAGLIQLIFPGRQMEVPGGAREPLTAMEAMLKPGVGKTFDVTAWVRVSEFFPPEITSVNEVEKSLEKLRRRLCLCWPDRDFFATPNDQIKSMR